MEIWRFFSAILLVSNQNNPFSNQIGSIPYYGEGRTKMSQKLSLQLGVEANNCNAFERNDIR